jgi:hypothetical protein
MYGGHCVMAGSGLYGYIGSSTIPLLHADKYNITINASNYSDAATGKWISFSGLHAESANVFGFQVTIWKIEIKHIL